MDENEEMKGEALLPEAGGHYGLGDWHTHLPLLLEVLFREKPKRILELGAGAYSTLLLSTYTRNNPGTHCLSLENDPDWFPGLQWMSHPTHEIRLVDKIRLEELAGEWDFVLIDFDPEMERIPALEFFRTQGARLVMVHDCNYSCRYGDTLEKFNHVLHDRRHKFHTTLASDTCDVTLWTTP